MNTSGGLNKSEMNIVSAKTGSDKSVFNFKSVSEEISKTLTKESSEQMSKGKL